MIRERVLDLIRPAVLAMPRGRMLLVSALGGGGNAQWKNCVSRCRMMYDPAISAYVVRELNDWAARYHYYTGYYYDRLNACLINTCLQEGDVYIDVGANIGLHSLLASKVVGSRGMVVSIEANPRAFGLLKGHLALNHRNNVTALNVGLSDERSMMILSGNDNELGSFSFLKNDSASAQYQVSVEIGDSVLEGLTDAHKVTLLKVDVEGYEAKVLRGLAGVMKRLDVAVVCEVTPKRMRQVGDCADKLMADIKNIGYEIYSVETTISAMGKASVRLRQLGEFSDEQQDVVMLRATGLARARLNGIIES